MSLPRLPIRTLLLLLAAVTAHAQSAATPDAIPAKKPTIRAPKSAYNPNLILLDPGHGGTDTGAKLTDSVLEKDATIALANRIKTLLVASGFTVILTHEASSDQLSQDQRAEVANRSRAAACILLHASNGGHGVHLFTSALPPTFRSADPDEAPPILSWQSAQSASLAQSTRLATALSDPLYALRVPLVVGHVSVPPIDSMTCPSIAVELAPLVNPDDADTPTPATDATYQQRIATALATGLGNWRTYLQGQIAGAAMSATPPVKPAAPPVKKTPPKPIPIETPVAPAGDPK